MKEKPVSKNIFINLEEAMIKNLREGHGIFVRPYEEEDYKLIYTLAKNNLKPFIDKHWGGWDSRIFKKEFEPHATKVIEFGSNFAGFYQAKYYEESAHIVNIHIQEMYRNMMLGSKAEFLVRTAAFHDREIDEIGLRTFKDNRALSWYKRLGYTEDKNFKIHKYVETLPNSVVLGKKLTEKNAYDLVIPINTNDAFRIA
ncbi:MAG: hypothetical protein ABH828_01465 [archaeon]